MSISYEIKGLQSKEQKKFNKRYIEELHVCVTKTITLLF
jgi:hypothetical protein